MGQERPDADVFEHGIADTGASRKNLRFYRQAQSQAHNQRTESVRRASRDVVLSW